MTLQPKYASPVAAERADDETVINLDERQAAKFLGIGARTLWQLRKEGSVPYVRIGRSIRYPKPLLVKWLMEQATTGDGAVIGGSTAGTTASSSMPVQDRGPVDKTGT